MRLRLTNNHNFCYANSVIRCLLWLGRAGADTDFFSRQGIVALKSVLDHRDRRHALWRQLEWRFAVHTWREPLRQHDAAEFFSYVAPKVCLSSLFDGEWSERTQAEDSIVDSECRDCLQPISLALDGSTQHDAQHLIHQWHSQAAIHALRRPPQLLVLRFAREAGGLLKDTSAIRWAPRLNMPVFTGRWLESENVCYHVCAAVLHQGPDMQAGTTPTTGKQVNSSSFVMTIWPRRPFLLSIVLSTCTARARSTCSSAKELTVKFSKARECLRCVSQTAILSRRACTVHLRVLLGVMLFKRCLMPLVPPVQGCREHTAG